MWYLLCETDIDVDHPCTECLACSDYSGTIIVSPSMALLLGGVRKNKRLRRPLRLMGGFKAAGAGTTPSKALADEDAYRRDGAGGPPHAAPVSSSDEMLSTSTSICAGGLGAGDGVVNETSGDDTEKASTGVDAGANGVPLPAGVPASSLRL